MRFLESAAGSGENERTADGNRCSVRFPSAKNYFRWDSGHYSARNRGRNVRGLLAAEGVGFEPTVGCPTLDFESSALNRTQPPFLPCGGAKYRTQLGQLKPHSSAP